MTRVARSREVPYVISEDIGILLGQWAEKRNLKTVPAFIMDEIRYKFKGILLSPYGFWQVQSVSELELSQGMASLTQSIGLLPVSMDRVYYPTSLSIDLTRTVNSSGEDRGLAPRFGSPPLAEQIARIKQTGEKEVALVDDVVFSGGVASEVIQSLEAAGVKVPVMCAGVGIGAGMDRLKSMGVEIKAVRSYPEVIDQVCERDFFPGVPYSGRTLDVGENIGVPYIMPFGNPVKWASLPEDGAEWISYQCLDLTRELFRCMEISSGRPILSGELARAVGFTPIRPSLRYTEYLESVEIYKSPRAGYLGDKYIVPRSAYK